MVVHLRSSLLSISVEGVGRSSSFTSVLTSVLYLLATIQPNNQIYNLPILVILIYSHNHGASFPQAENLPRHREEDQVQWIRSVHQIYKTYNNSSIKLTDLTRKTSFSGR